MTLKTGIKMRLITRIKLRVNAGIKIRLNGLITGMTFRLITRPRKSQSATESNSNQVRVVVLQF